MELDGDRLFIGIGCNVVQAPSIELTGADGGRPATCIKDHYISSGSIEGSTQESSEIPDDFAFDIANGIFTSVLSWIQSEDTVAAVTEEYMRQVKSIL
jgi:hypothetical protein